MAKPQSWGQDAEVISEPLATGQGVVIPSAPKDVAAESRAQTGTQINVSEEARAGRKEQFDYAKSLRDELRKAPEATNYETVIRQFSSALSAQPTPTGDQALITAYAKMLDPGSVVRTEEFNTVAAGDSKLGSIVARLNKELGVDDSGLIRPEIRNRVLSEMRNLADNYKVSYERIRGDYQGLAGRYGVDPALVIGTSIDAPYQGKIEELWKSKNLDAAQGEQLAITGGERFSTEQDKAIAAAVNSAFAAGADVQGLVEAAQQAGANVTAEDVANFQAAIEARANKQPVTFDTRQSGTRSPMAQAAGEALMTPAGTALTGAVNAAGLGLLSQVAGDQVQGLEALNPLSGMAGEIVGSALGTAGIGRAAGGALGMAAPGLASRLAGGGVAGMAGRELAKDVAYGGIYGANTGEGFGQGALLGAAGSIGGQAVAAGARRVAPVVSGMFRRGGDVPPDGGVPPMGGGPDGMPPVTNQSLFDEMLSSSGVSDVGPANKKIPLGKISVQDSDFNQKIYTSESGARIAVMEDAKFAPRKNSITDFVVPEDVRRQGLGGQLLDQVLSQYDPKEISAAASSDASAALFYKRGFRPISKPDARLKDVLDIRREDSSVTMAIPEDGKFTPKKVSPTSGAAMQAADETFIPNTVRSRDAGSAGTSEETIRAQRAAELPVPVELARFQRSRLFEEQQRARELAKNNEVGGPIRARLAEQQDALRQNFDRFIDETGSEVWENAREKGVVVDAALKKLADVGKTRIRVLYKRAEKAGETAEAVPYAPIKAFIDDQDVTTREKLAPVLDAVANQLRKNDPDGTGTISINSLENIRKLINKVAQPGTPDASFGNELKGLIDQTTEGAGGDLYKQARAARIQYANTFENAGLVKKLMGTKPGTVDRQVALEKVAEQAIYSRGTALDDIKALKGVLDQASSRGERAWRELQGATLEHIRDQAYKGVTRDESGQAVISPAALERVITDLDRSGKLDYVFGRRTADLLRTINDVAKDVVTAPPGSVNASGTSSAVLNAIDTLGTFGISGMPIPGGKLLMGLKSALQNRELRKEVKRLLD